MGPIMDYVGQREFDRLTLDIYPEGNSTFNMYENGSSYVFSCSTTAKHIFVSIPPSGRSYFLKINENNGPWQIKLNDEVLPEIKDIREFESAETGWRYFTSDKKYTGILIPEGKVPETAYVTFERK